MCLSIFLFSSRRRHTRFDCDWSSDVCSSDLTRQADPLGALERAQAAFIVDATVDGIAQGLRAAKAASREDLDAIGRRARRVRSEERRVGKECRARWWRSNWSSTAALLVRSIR